MDSKAVWVYSPPAARKRLTTTMKIESYLAEKVRDIVTEIAIDALENRDAVKTLAFLRSQLIAGWEAALEAIDTPPEVRRNLTIR